MELAPVKKEFIIQNAERVICEDYISEKDKQAIHGLKRGGRNKKRPTNTAKKQCGKILRGEICPYGDDCRYSHEQSVVTKLNIQCVFNKCPYGLSCRLEHNDNVPAHQSTIYNVLTINDRNKIRNSKISEINTKNSLPKENMREPRSQPRVDLRDKLYLAPLTTVGNLPFRRVCVGLGAQITCSEMVVDISLLGAKQSEWALVKRHESEKIFGIQLCGSNPNTMSECARVFDDTQFSVDFLDINAGCPIDCIYKKGAGSALLGRPNRLISILDGMTSCSSLPVSVKMRTGISINNNVVVSLVEKLTNAGKASYFTVHGRSREQRYSKSADWETVSACVNAAGSIPVFGNGDILSYSDYETRRSENPSMAGVMIGRGALIKPWIFTEIAERRDWDISSKQRFEILERYRDYALEHWGSDSRGVENARRFILEWLSFLHRYIPVGLLERLPQAINVRPPTYFGRDDLETLMASANCSDWIKISELLLGPVPDDFKFLPKHRANAYQPISLVDLTKVSS